MSSLNIDVPTVELQWDTAYSVSIGPIQVEVKAGTSYKQDYTRKTDLDYTRINISNGNFSEEILSNTVNKLNDIDQSIKSMITSDGTISVLNDFALEIGNGQLDFGYGINSAGNFEIHYLIQEELWNDENGNAYTIYYSISFSISSQQFSNHNASDMALAMSDLNTVALVAIALLLVVALLTFEAPQLATILEGVVVALVI